MITQDIECIAVPSVQGVFYNKSCIIGLSGIYSGFNQYLTDEMIELTIPGRGTIRLDNLVSDVNGTLALDGQLMEGLSRRLKLLEDRLAIHLLTAGTHGQLNIIEKQLNIQTVRVEQGREAQQKAEFVTNLGADHVVAIGQGANDSDMLKKAQIGIGVMSREGLAVDALVAADIIVPDIFSALELIEKPIRLVATLRK